MRVTHSWTDDAATIKVEGLEAPVTMLHVTDPHVGLVDERDSDYLQGGVRHLTTRIMSSEDTMPFRR